MSLVPQLLLMLVVILIAAELFTNAIEHFGERWGLSEGVTGSLFAAMATAMPESTIPLVAIFAGKADPAINAEIGVGAILGAPLMLATLSFFVTGLAVVKARGFTGSIHPERSGLARDLGFFLTSFGLAIVGLWVPPTAYLWRTLLAVGLIATYLIYVLRTMKVSSALVESGHATEAHAEMYLCRAGLPDHGVVILLQILLGVGLLILGAKGCVDAVEEVAATFRISPLLLSLLIIPLATELPENVNSLLWIRRRKDTLAIGNITGAMVFQGCLLPALGILMTPWQPSREVLAGVAVTYAAALWLLWNARREGLKVWHFILNGALYVGYIVAIL